MRVLFQFFHSELKIKRIELKPLRALLSYFKFLQAIFGYYLSNRYALESIEKKMQYPRNESKSVHSFCEMLDMPNNKYGSN